MWQPCNKAIATLSQPCNNLAVKTIEYLEEECSYPLKPGAPSKFWCSYSLKPGAPSKFWCSYL